MRALRLPLCAVAALFLLLPCAYSAESPAAGAPAPTASAPQEAGENTPANTPTIKVQSNLVLQVDVVVTKNGAPVKGLAKDQFHVLENGKEQELRVFEEHSEETQATPAANAASAGAPSADASPVSASAPETPALPPNTYSDFTPYPPSSAVSVLLLDSMNTLITDQSFVRQKVLAYLKQVPPGTRMAVFTLSTRLRMIQGFTADPDEVVKAITAKDEVAPSLADARKTSWESQEQAIEDMLLGGISDVVRVQQQAADLKSFYTDQQEKATLEALRQIAQYLGTIPGRKNLIWFSGAFPLNIDPPVSNSAITMKDPDTGELVMDYCNPHPMRTPRDYSTEVRETDRLLTAARVAVYPIDAQGLLGENAFNASTEQSTVLCLAPRKDPVETMRQVTTFQRQAREEHHNEQSTMQQVADDTGGRAFVNTNGLQAALQQALNDGENYYTVGYTPESKDDGQFHHIKVKLDGGYDLDYRDGYYADAQGRGPGSGATAMREAVEFGAPPPSEIPFKVRVIAASDPAASGITPAAGPAGANAKDLKGPLTRYLVDYLIDAHSFAFNKTEDGLEHAQLEFSVVAYDADGKRINVTDNAFAFGMTPPIYAQVMAGGFPRHLEIDLPEGQVSLRIVVHDMNSGKAGATEVPLTVAKNQAANK